MEFESAVCLVEVTIWSSGEADLSTVRLTDDRVVNKHYELADRTDLDALLDKRSGCSLMTSFRRKPSSSSGRAHRADIGPPPAILRSYAGARPVKGK